MSKKISILIANYNNGEFFQDCWNSLVNQTYSNWEAIIVDDKSTDNSVEIIRQIIHGDSRAKLHINERNLGCGYTKRRCAELGCGELYGFLDPDDTLEPNALELMNSVFSENTSVVLAYSKHRRYDSTLTNIISKEYNISSIDSKDIFYFNLSGTITAFAVFKADAYKKTAGIDAYMLRAVDQDLYLKLCEMGETMPVHEYLYKYRIHANGISTGDGIATVSKAEYWQWYAINAAAKRRGVYVEDLFSQYYINKSMYNKLAKDYQLVLNSVGFKLSRKLSAVKSIFFKKK
ncbi:MAG: hypothetical protein K0S53_1101 [Bacteroidetes bacterium]|jgi:glycosyltransferase involved in cell wall biosynthesis|nr:hypothetical protein [Bacteroidota bacterium]